MSKGFKKDYIALQNLWYECAMNYLHSDDKERPKITDDFRDCLVDIKPKVEDKEEIDALRTNYEEWEQDTWLPFCKSKLLIWTQNNVYESRVKKNKVDEFENIKQDYNYQRFRKIMQIIQDSNIGLGKGSGSSKGYYVGADNLKDFTG